MDQDNHKVIITFRGFCSKKNRKAPGKGGIYLEKKTRLALERMELQVPAEYRDLNLEHPTITWEFTYTNAHVDRDGIITTVLDILQKYRVIRNDNIAHCNGQWTVRPAVRGEYDSVTVILDGSTEPLKRLPLKVRLDESQIRRMREAEEVE